MNTYKIRIETKAMEEGTSAYLFVEVEADNSQAALKTFVQTSHDRIVGRTMHTAFDGYMFRDTSGDMIALPKDQISYMEVKLK